MTKQAPAAPAKPEKQAETPAKPKPTSLDAVADAEVAAYTASQGGKQ